ncbi:ATP-binding protein [Paenibacillus thalictri]|nr:ATP-binding protein [Paenibacillus thalictri]
MTNMFRLQMQTYVLWLAVMVLGLTIFVPIYNDVYNPHLNAKAGVIDLKGWNAAADKPVRLDGEWEFYWDALLKPEDWASENPAIPSREWINVPSSWDSLTPGGVPLPNSGYATYRLRILLPDGEKTVYGIKTSNIRASNRIFANGKLIGQSGKPAASAAEIVHGNTPYTAFFEAGSEVELIVQVASYKSFNSGIVQSISFGSQQSIAQTNNYYHALDGGLAWGFFITSIYFAGIFLQQRREQKPLLFFALCCLSATFYELSHSERLLAQIFPDISIEMMLYVEDISSILMFSFFSRYVYHSFPKLYPQKLMYAIELIAMVCIAAVLFTSASYNGPFIFALTLLILAVMLLNSWYMALAAGYAGNGSTYLYVGILGTMDFVAVSVLNTVWKLEPYYFFPIALPVLIMSQALYMAGQYTNSFETIKRLSDQLSVLDKMKDDFLAKTSHELKSPLNGIINMAQSLIRGAGGPISEPQASDLRLMMDTGKRLANLVNDILDYSKMKNSDLQLRPNHFDCYPLVENILETFRYTITGRSIQLVNNIPPNTHIVYADENRYSQIIYNLVDNAVKFTAFGQVELSANETGGFVHVTVKDTGSGIPNERLEDIFVSFEQLEPSLTRSHSGAGLGLAITRQLVELHGGEIRVESEVGAGSQFTVSIPAGNRSGIHPSQAAADVTNVTWTARETGVLPITAMPSSADIERNPEKAAYRVLVADDDYSNLKALVNLLVIEHYQVTAVSSGEAALRELELSAPYDLCILDVMMPVMSGYDVCLQIREHYSLLELPVLMVTAQTPYRNLNAVFAAGANDFLEKPYDYNELKSRVSTLVQLKQSAEESLRRELAFLRAQIKPHFLHNTINAIIAYSYSDQERCRKLLRNFSFYLRHCFDFKETDQWIRVEQELHLVNCYLDIEKARFGDMLETSITVDPGALNCLIPPLMIQPLVENAIKHGILKKEDGGTLTLLVALRGNSLHVEIADDGVGMNAAGQEAAAAAADDLGEDPGTGVALDNVRKRLLHLFGTDLRISSEPGLGTTIEIDIPATRNMAGASPEVL